MLRKDGDERRRHHTTHTHTREIDGMVWGGVFLEFFFLGIPYLTMIR